MEDLSKTLKMPKKRYIRHFILAYYFHIFYNAVYPLQSKFTFFPIHFHPGPLSMVLDKCPHKFVITLKSKVVSKIQVTA